MKSSSCCRQQSHAGSQDAILTCGAVNFLGRLLPTLSSWLFSGLLASFDSSFGVGRRGTAMTLEGGKNTRHVTEQNVTPTTSKSYSPDSGWLYGLQHCNFVERDSILVIIKSQTHDISSHASALRSILVQ